MRHVDTALITRGFEEAPPRIDRRTKRGIVSGEIGWQAAGADRLLCRDCSIFGCCICRPVDLLDKSCE